MKKNIIGRKLRQLRRARGLSVADLAARLGSEGQKMDAAALRAIEKQTGRVRDHEVLALARALGVKADELFPRRSTHPAR
jgi:transcriptional regulator with XRE-family HTH domain